MQLPDLIIINVDSLDAVDHAVRKWIDENKDAMNDAGTTVQYVLGSAYNCFNYVIQHAHEPEASKRTTYVESCLGSDDRINIQVTHAHMK